MPDIEEKQTSEGVHTNKLSQFVIERVDPNIFFVNQDWLRKRYRHKNVGSLFFNELSFRNLPF